MIVLAIIGFVLGGSISLFVSVLVGTDFRAPSNMRWLSSGYRWRTWLPVAVVSLVVAVVAIALSGAVVAGLSLGAVVVGVPRLVDHRRAGRVELERIDAMAVFASQMAQGFGGGAGLAKTVIDASIHPPLAIYDEVVKLRAALEAGSFADALHTFADDVGTPHAAKLAANLIAAEQENATALQARLVRIAKGAQETAAVSRLVRRERRQQAIQVPIITMILGAVVAFVLFTSPDIASVFSGSVTGELKFAFIAGLVLTAWFVSARLDENVALEEFTLRSERTTP